MKFNIKITAGMLLLAVIAFSMSYVAFAADDITILINGEELITSQKAVFVKKMAFVPMNEVFESLGASVTWNGEKTKASCLYNDAIVTIDIENSEIIKNGEKIPFNLEAVAMNGTVMVSLKTVADSLDCSVIWRGEDRIASIASKKELMKIHFIDCGHADSIFVQFPNGKCMLVDAAVKDFGESLENFIREKGYDHIDYVVATHPHSDHIGGMSRIIKNFTIGSFYTPNVIRNTPNFRNMLNALEEKNYKINFISQGDKIDIPSYSVRVLSPEKRQYLRMNNYSAVLKIAYNKVSAVLCADAETDSEREILQNESDLKTDVIKVGHHGSFTSTSTGFLKALQPRDAIISVGKDNEYGYPNKNIINRLKKKGIKIHRTDEDGNITMVTDGYIHIIVPEGK